MLTVDAVDSVSPSDSGCGAVQAVVTDFPRLAIAPVGVVRKGSSFEKRNTGKNNFDTCNYVQVLLRWQYSPRQFVPLYHILTSLKHF